MKQAFLLSVLALAMGTSTFANAALQQTGSDENEKLKVNINIRAPVCNFILNSGANVELGIINPSQLSKDHAFTLPTQKKISLNVDCEAKAFVSMSLVDTYANTLLNGSYRTMHGGAGPSTQFGLVDANNKDSVLIGSYRMHMTDVRDTDNGRHFNLKSANNGFRRDQFFQSSINDENRAPDIIFFSDKDKSETLHPSKNLVIEFDLYPEILPTSKINAELNTVVDVVGETTFKMVYL